MSCQNTPKVGNFILVLSVGGSPEPLIESIRHYKPAYVIFVASRDSNEKIMEVLRQVDSIVKYETITLSDFQNLVACVREIRDELPKKIEAMKLDSDTLCIADITGGTKVMSAALALAMMEFNSRFSYVGGDTRTKGGLGTVESGHEKIMRMDNPWDAIGLREARSLVLYFNAGQFEAAREMAEFLKSRDSEYSAFYDGLAKVIDAFRHWDIFNYKTAKNLFATGLARLGVYNNRRHANFRGLYENLQRAQSMLDEIERDAKKLNDKFQPLADGEGQAYLRDLAANARRCAMRGHHDDAVARLYSAVEKSAKIALAKKGINNSNVDREKLAQANEALAAKYACGSGETIKMPLTDSFLLLRSLDPENPVAQAFTKGQEDLAKTLEARNKSLLAHGYSPVSEKDYEKLYNVAMQFLNMSESDILDFPQLDIKAILF